MTRFDHAMTALAVAVAIGLAPSKAGAVDFCQATTQVAYRSCQLGAQSDDALALGKCDNVADAGERKSCQSQALADMNDALKLCKAERDVRQASCALLGPAPYDPVIDPANFSTKIDNPYFPLTPGTTYIYESQTSEGFKRTEFAVTHNTKVILGVTCVEVHDTVKTNDEVTEDTLDWFAQDKSGNVWYFGESTEELIGGRPTTLAGTFTSGVDRAQPGIIMEAHPAVGDFYRQEFDLGNAEDFAKVISLTESVTVPAGSFTNCLKTFETTPLEPNLHENKFYAKGVGNLLTVDLGTGERVQLVKVVTQ